MAIEIHKFNSASDLPEDWDDLANDYFQTSEFLLYTEKYNACNQRYYLYTHDDVFQAGLIVYNLSVDIFTYMPISLPFNMKVVGVPCSVSSDGLIGDAKSIQILIEKIKQFEKGYLLILNTSSMLETMKSAFGRALPTVLFRNSFQSWDDYLAALRSDYKRRLLKISRPFLEIKKVTLPCSQFNNTMYEQYINVLKKSNAKLEVLSHDFFKNLPSPFKLTAFYSETILVGWFITTSTKNKFYFFLGGVDYGLNKKFNTYLNLLFEVLREGIEHKAEIIDLGQTAEIPKTRLGGIIEEKYMTSYHSNNLLNSLIRLGSGFLEYSRIVSKTNVFKL